MRIDRDDGSVSWEDVAGLFQAVGWDERKPDELRSAFGRSSFRAFAFEGDELVGFGRTIDDGRYYAMVVDVVVSPAHQGRGIGRAIMEDIQGRLEGFRFTTLIARPAVQPFYRRLGWRNQTTAMIRPRDEDQARLNCAES